MIAVAAPSRHDAPELAHTLPRTPMTFEAERAAEALADLFVDIELERWDARLLRLPTVRPFATTWRGRASSQSAPSEPRRPPVCR
jgi:hypothetical protein